VKSLWEAGFDFSLRGTRRGSAITVPALAADWRAQITPAGDGPVRSDMAESLAKASQIASLATLEEMMGRGRGRPRS
jgi:hypothetical protein